MIIFAKKTWKTVDLLKICDRANSLEAAKSVRIDCSYSPLDILSMYLLC